MRGRRDWTATAVGAIALLAMAAAAGCARPSATPAPEAAQTVLGHVRDGYASQKADTLCQDFAAIMFTKGFTKQAYLNVIQRLHQQLGAWVSETYMGEKTDVYTWRVKFEKGAANLVIVLSPEGKVTGLWFRP